MPRWWTNNIAKGKGKTNAKGKGRGKGAKAPDWLEAYSQIPPFGSSDSKILLFNVKDFYEDQNPYSVQPTRSHERSTEPGQLIRSPSDAFVRCRLPMSQSYDQTVHRTYFKAMDALYQASVSIEHYYVMEESSSRYFVNLHGVHMQGWMSRGPTQGTHDLLDERLKETLGDFWRVLRTRPSATVGKPSKDVEYVPNSMYSYYKVKTTLMQVQNLPVKMTRYWNELLVKDVPNDILYSLSDYCPGMPREAVIVKDNEALGLPVYRPDEAKYGNIDPATRRKTVDVNGTIQALIGFGAIPDEEQASLEAYMTNVQEMIMKYDRLTKSWPFLIAERLLKMQMSRLIHIKTALTEKLDNHPLSSANCASFGSNIPTGIPSALADFEPQTREGQDEQSQQSAYRSGYDNRSGRGQ